MLRSRMIRVLAAAGLVGAIGVAAIGAGPAQASPLRDGTLVPTPGQVLPLHGGTADSLNWAGYAVTPATGITAVSSTFTVPSAGAVPPGFSATWAGIGGYTTSDLIQAGVSEEGSAVATVLGPQYYAWYEILPASETQISGCSGDANCTVSPGDTVTVNISLASANEWNVSIADSGHWTWSQEIAYTSSESSAEWIQEAPTLVVQTIPAAVGTVSFGPTSTYTENGTTYTIADGPTSPTLVDESPVGEVNEATTSPLASDGQSFNVCVYAQTCAAP